MSLTATDVQNFLKDIRTLAKVSVNRRFVGHGLYEYPFDQQLLTVSSLYRESRKQYVELGGQYFPRISSTMRSLSAQDLFADEIDYTPAHTELTWFSMNSGDVHDPEEEVISLERFSTISIFHEQNHRIIWRLLPPAAKGDRALSRYLNFAESLVVMLDLALADQIGPKLAPIFERMKVIYRAGSAPYRLRSERTAYRDYLIAAQFATYLILELVNPDDVNAAVNFVLPGQKSLNRSAVQRALDINELFTRVTNPHWQERNLKRARKSLAKMHAGFDGPPLELPKDPLDFEDGFELSRYVLDQLDL
ncbi:MAG: hypothetical protein J0L82_09975 [Deltaproteobacteria bacterium]|jgi:hypothetical protein|nr:hypothetical protein [Deltaproteobacteria bacterium]